MLVAGMLVVGEAVHVAAGGGAYEKSLPILLSSAVNLKLPGQNLKQKVHPLYMTRRNRRSPLLSRPLVWTGQ